MTTFDAVTRSITKYATGKTVMKVTMDGHCRCPSEVRRRTHAICVRSNRSSAVNMFRR